mgnify:CR=1 FL=1
MKIHSHMLIVHLEANIEMELEKMINTMIKKFKQNLEVWVNCAKTLLKMRLKDKSRHIMQRALESLVPSESM